MILRADRDHALVDGGGRVRAGHRRADQLAGRPIDDDRDVAGVGLDRVALRALREVGDALERVEPGGPGLVEGHAHRRRLRVHVRRPRQRAVVGDDRLAQGHPHGQLALVVALVGVQLRSGRVARHPQAVGELEPAVALVGVRPGDLDRRTAPSPGPGRGTRGPRRAGWCGPRPSSRRRGRRRARRRRRPRHGLAAHARRSGPARRRARGRTGRPRRCAGARSGRGAVPTGRRSSAPRSARTPGRARTRSGRRRARAGSGEAPGSAWRRSWSRGGSRRGRRSAAPSTSSRPRR